MSTTAAKPKPFPLDVTRDTLGEALHVALRKGCDSAVTSLLWQIISLMDNEVYGAYLDHVWVDLLVATKVPGANKESIAEALKLSSLGFDKSFWSNPRDRRRDTMKTQWITVLDLIFPTLSESDWEGFASFLYDE